MPTGGSMQREYSPLPLQVEKCLLTSPFIGPFDHFVQIRSEKPKGSLTFAHFGRSKVQFPRVAGRISTSILLVTVLLAGAITPTGVCALMCERHVRPESQHHCGQSPDAMPGMTYHHSITTRADTDAVTPVLMSQSCPSN